MASSDLPEGYSLDPHPAALPEGYKLDTPKAAPKAKINTGRGMALAVGALEPFYNLGSAALSMLPDSVRPAPDGTFEAARDANKHTNYMAVGNMVGTAPMAVAKGGLAATGAVQGAALSRQKTAGGVAVDALIGAGSSVVGGAITRGLAAAISPRVAPVIKRLAAEGMEFTPGQILGAAGGYLGKLAKGSEDRLTGFPIVGDAITAARQRGVDSFNSAAINRALAPIGEKLEGGVRSGREAIAQAGDKLSAAYDALVPNLAAIVDNPFAAANTIVLKRIAKVAPSKVGQFQSIVDDAIGTRAPGDVLKGEALKVAESKLAAEADRFTKSLDPDQQILGQGLKTVLGNFRDLIARNNPAHGEQLAKINRGYANLVRVEKAAATAKDGVFSPAQLAVAARQSGTRKTAARGTALMADLADDARAVLPSGVGDSGTAGRGALGLLAGGVLGLPAVAGAAGAALPYTRVGSKIAQAALTGRQGQVPQYLSRLVASGTRPVSIAAPALLRRPDD